MSIIRKLPELWMNFPAMMEEIVVASFKANWASVIFLFNILNLSLSSNRANHNLNQSTKMCAASLTVASSRFRIDHKPNQFRMKFNGTDNFKMSPFLMDRFFVRTRKSTIFTLVPVILTWIPLFPLAHETAFPGCLGCTNLAIDPTK